MGVEMSLTNEFITIANSKLEGRSPQEVSEHLLEAAACFVVFAHQSRGQRIDPETQSKILGSLDLSLAKFSAQYYPGTYETPSIVPN